MTVLHWILAAVALVLLAAFAYLYGVTWIESRQARRLEDKQPYASTSAGTSRTAVVYSSRSGNTALAAHHRPQALRCGLAGFARVALQPRTADLGLCGTQPLRWPPRGAVQHLQLELELTRSGGRFPV